MLTALVLICSLTATPDLGACTRESALTVVRVPEEFAMPSQCFMHAQAYIAETAIGALAANERVKIVCGPSEKVAAARPRTPIAAPLRTAIDQLDR
jgi:hypothetical protein